MALSSDLLSQFAKVTKDETKTKSDTTVYGTIVLQNGEKYVRIDGSDLLTPISSTTNVDDKERVTVMIKNHMATVTGNISSPAARGIEVDATNESVRRIEADYVKTKDLEAEYAKIENLDATYANIDFANIGTAAMEYFYAKSGLIKNVTVGDQTITGELVGVTIRGDRIIGNTVIADKLVIKGSDGLFYKLNTDGMNVETEQTSENSLNGSIITAKSITATKISVSDLVAFDATIGGFKIEDTSIHSIAKTSVDNTTRGLYLGSDGQMALGDASNFLKYYKDANGKYKLAISADSFVFSSDGRDVASAIDDIQIGGTNYLLNSGISISNATYNIANYQFGSMKPVVGETYTLRIWGSLGSGRTHFTAYNTNGYINLGQLVNNGDGTFSVPITWKNNAAESQSQYSVSTPTQLQIYQFPRDGTSVSTITRIKLEKGNRATDWSPHPDDIQVGGRNLLRNTSNLKNGNYAFDASGADKQGTVTYLDEGMRITCASANVRWWLGGIPVTPGQTYAISVRYKIISGSAPIQFQYRYRNSSNTAVAFGGSSATQATRTEDGWTVLSDSFTVPSDSAIVKVEPAIRTGLDYELYTVTYDICKPKLEIGNKATDWTPAPEDTDAEFENVRSEISVTKNEIKLAVDEIRPGGTNLIRNTKRLKNGSTIDTWSHSSGAWFYDDASGFARGQFSTSGYTSDTWSWVQSPLVELPSGWQGRQVTFSTYIWSENWAAVDNGISISLCLSTGEKSRTNYGSVRAVLYNGGSPIYGGGVKAEHPLTNGKWLRISMTFTLDKSGLTGNTSNDLDANTHMYVTYWLVRNGGYRFYAPKLEWGNKATDWSPHPEEFEAGTNVLITKDQFSVTTPEFNVNITSPDGTENMLNIDETGIHAQSIDCPNVAQRYDGPGTLYVNPNATSAQIAAGNYFRSLNDAFSALNNKTLAYNVTINMAAGMTEYGTVTLVGTLGGAGWIIVEGNSSNRAKLIGRMNIYHNQNPIRVRYLNIDSAVNDTGMELANGYSEISNCTITGKGTAGTVNGATNTGSVGIKAMMSACVQVSNCELYDTYRSLYVQTLGQMQSVSNKGNCTIGTNRSHVFIEGTAPCESTTWTVSKVGGGQAWVASNVTVDQGSKPSTPTVTTTTVSYTMTNADVYAGGGWNNYSNSDIYQGYTSALGEHRGCFWFDNTTIRSALNGKTIKQVTLSLYQMSGSGRNQPVQVNLEGITVNYGASSTPYGNPEYGVIGTTLGVNQITTFTIPTKVITDLVAGTINGLMLRTGETAVMSGQDNSYHFARFAGGTTTSYRPKLTITYT